MFHTLSQVPSPHSPGDGKDGSATRASRPQVDLPAVVTTLPKEVIGRRKAPENPKGTWLLTFPRPRKTLTPSFLKVGGGISGKRQIALRTCARITQIIHTVSTAKEER